MFVALLALQAVSHGDHGTTVRTIPRPTTTTEAPLTLTPDGLGPITIGMPWSVAISAGVALVSDHQPTCQIGTYEGATVYGHLGKVTDIVVQTDGIRTDEGIAVGASGAALRKLYPVAGETALQLGTAGRSVIYGLRDEAIVYMRATDGTDASC